MAQRLQQSAVENARLYYAVRQRAERTADVIQLTKVVSVSFDLGAVYETFAGELKTAHPVQSDGDGDSRGLRHEAQALFNLWAIDWTRRRSRVSGRTGKGLVSSG